MIKILHLSDIHLGSGFCHGRINPETGFNTRFEDFTATLRTCIDRALAEPADLVLFSGDAFPDATPPPFVQQAFAQQFHRLVIAGIPAVLLVGNHDQHSHGTGGASLCIYRTLGVPGMVVGDRLETHRIQTRSGPVQVITVPWLTHSTLLTRPDTEGCSIAAVDELLIHRFGAALEGEIRRLDPDCPTVLLAHAMVDAARYGAEKFLAVSKGFTLPLALLARPCFDYVALGHVHRHQILCEQPLTLYPGSIERVDFSEEKEDKGYVLVELEVGSAKAEFCPLEVRPFQTLELDVSETEDPQGMILGAIEQQLIPEAVVRLICKLRPDQLDQVDNGSIHDALSAAHTYTIRPEITSFSSRQRFPELTTNTALTPLEALKTYLDHRADLADIADEMVETAQVLLSGKAGFEAEDQDDATATSLFAGLPRSPAADFQPPDEETNTQLRLL